MNKTFNKYPTVKSSSVKGFIAIMLLCFLYFFRSFVMYIDIFAPVSTAECHTGAIAKEILENGFQFPLEQYTPEYYENSIITQGLLTVASVRFLGLNQLALEIIPFIFSFAVMLIFCSLLIHGGFRSGLFFFIVSYLFLSGFFLIITMDSVGNHIIGLFLGALITHQFFRGYITGNPRHFYIIMFTTGLGLFAQIGFLLYAGLVFMAYLFYKPQIGTKPRLSLSMIIRGMFLFLIGAIPFIIFLFKTKMMSVLSLFTVATRRNIGVQDLGVYGQNIFQQYLLQFDFRIWILALYSGLALLIYALWMYLRKKTVPENTRLLVYIICFFIPPVFISVSVVSGGEFTTYHTYLMPLLFLAGAVVLSHAINFCFATPTSRFFSQTALSAILLLVLINTTYFKSINLSTGHAFNKLTSDENLSFCYWRFGSSFSNYAPYRGDSVEYASKMLSMCGRFHSEERKNECLWGWNMSYAPNGFVLDAQTIEALGPQASDLVARSMGGWTRTINTCFEINEAYVDNCILGFVERMVIEHNDFFRYYYIIKGLEYSEIQISCLPESPRFSGLNEVFREKMRKGSLDDGPQICVGDQRIVCILSDAYCAAQENRKDFCDKSYSSSMDTDLCHLIFQRVSSAQDSDSSF